MGHFDFDCFADFETRVEIRTPAGVMAVGTWRYKTENSKKQDTGGSYLQVPPSIRPA